MSDKKKRINYYPFGLSHKGYNTKVSPLGNSAAKRYMFGGKEYQEELDLDWYDITARNYDPALGRWMNLDPLAEAMRRHSPYNYAFDNPIFFIDPDGMMPCPTGEDCPEEGEDMPPDAKAAKEYSDNLLQNFIDGLLNLFSSDSEETQERKSNSKIPRDGIIMYGPGVPGSDNQAGGGIVTGDDRGDGKPTELPVLGKKAFNKFLFQAVAVSTAIFNLNLRVQNSGNESTIDTANETEPASNVTEDPYGLKLEIFSGRDNNFHFSHDFFVPRHGVEDAYQNAIRAADSMILNNTNIDSIIIDGSHTLHGGKSTVNNTTIKR